MHVFFRAETPFCFLDVVGTVSVGKAFLFCEVYMIPGMVACITCAWSNYCVLFQREGVIKLQDGGNGQRVNTWLLNQLFTPNCFSLIQKQLLPLLLKQLLSSWQVYIQTRRLINLKTQKSKTQKIKKEVHVIKSKMNYYYYWCRDAPTEMKC